MMSGIILAKNDCGDMGVVSNQDYEEHKFRAEINFKLAEAEIDAAASTVRYSRCGAMELLRARLNAPRV